MIIPNVPDMVTVGALSALVGSVPGILAAINGRKRDKDKNEVEAFKASSRAAKDLIDEFRRLYTSVKADLDSSHQKHRQCEDQYAKLAIKHQELRLAFESHQLECIKVRS